MGAYKPRGFWYEVNGEWREWCGAENFGTGRYIHEVQLNDCNVLIIDTATKLDRFHNDFQIVQQLSPKFALIEIDWKRVSDNYDGVEIAPYQYQRRYKFMWYYGWDCASGVIWRPKNATVTYVGEWNRNSEEKQNENYSDQP